MQAKEIREKNDGELGKLLAEKRSRLLKLKFDIASKQIKNNREIRSTRLDIARILTIIKENKK